MLIYLATPYNHEDMDRVLQRVQNVNSLAANLIAEGFNIYSPITHSHEILQASKKNKIKLPRGWEYWKHHDREMIEKCDVMVVYAQEFWQHSEGVFEEKRIAQKLGIPVEVLYEGFSQYAFDHLINNLNKKKEAEKAKETQCNGIPDCCCDLECDGELVSHVKVNPVNDPVNHPSHYTSHPSGVECIDIAEHLNFCCGSAMKYIWRAGLKGTGINDAIQDLKKAEWFIKREIERLQKETKTNQCSISQK
jgi:hypothetical protein